MSRDQKTTPKPAHQPKPLKRAALLVSLVFHILLFAGLAIWIVNRKPTSDEAPLAQAEDATETPAPKPSPYRAEPSPDVSGKQIANTLERERAIARGKSTDEQLSALEEQAVDLEGLATSESIDEIAGKFHTWMNTESRASEPAGEPADGPFDFDTAQIHDVRKTIDEAGDVQYTSVLVDAAGRTFEVDVPPAEGEQAYRTMQTLKRYPLAERVYRQIAMGLIDRAVAKEAAKDKEDAPPGQRHHNPFDGQVDDHPSP